MGSSLVFSLGFQNLYLLQLSSVEVGIVQWFQKYSLYYPFCVSSSNTESPVGEGNNQKSKTSNLHSLVLYACLTLSTIAHCLKLSGRASSLFMLTTSPKEQLARFSVLAHHCSTNDMVATSLQPHCASAMLALASILSLESGGVVESSVPELALPLIPPTSTICSLLSIQSLERNEVTANQNGMLSYWHGLRDGCVGLLEARLKLGGPLAVQQASANGIPQLLISLLGSSIKNKPQQTDGAKDSIGPSPEGVVWTVSSLRYCLSSGALAFHEILNRTEHVKLICCLLSKAHLKLLKCWNGPGGGNDGVRDPISAVIDLLAFPFVAMQNLPGLPSATASVSSGFLLNMGSPGLCLKHLC